MNCMKCGREINEDQAFCPACLHLMEQYPVKPDVVVSLPLRRDFPVKKAPPRKKAPTAEEQAVRLKRKNRSLVVLVCLLLAVTLSLGFLSIAVLRQLDMQRFLGQNYSTAETTN